MQLPSLILNAFAQGQSISIINPLCPGSPTSCTVITILEKISGYLIILGAPILAIMIIYGAFLIMTAGGDPKKVTDGTHSIVYSAVGYGIVLVAWGIVSLTKELLTVL